MPCQDGRLHHPGATDRLPCAARKHVQSTRKPELIATILITAPAPTSTQRRAPSAPRSPHLPCAESELDRRRVATALDDLGARRFGIVTRARGGQARAFVTPPLRLRCRPTRPSRWVEGGDWFPRKAARPANHCQGAWPTENRFCRLAGVEVPRFRRPATSDRRRADRHQRRRRRVRQAGNDSDVRQRAGTPRALRAPRTATRARRPPPGRDGRRARN